MEKKPNDDISSNNCLRLTPEEKKLIGQAEDEELVRTLRLSQSFFVADTCEDDDDESLIPPTQDLLIPNTPPREEISLKEDNVSLKMNDDTTLSNLDETHLPEKEEEAEEEMDMTQDLPELDEETQRIVIERQDSGGDDWDLRFSDTQETQELLSSANRKISDSEKLPSISEEKEEDVSVLEDEKKTKEECAVAPTAENDLKCEAEIEEYHIPTPKVSMEPPTCHSTPDIGFATNGNSASKASEPPTKHSIPSPIPHQIKEKVLQHTDSESSSRLSAVMQGEDVSGAPPPVVVNVTSCTLDITDSIPKLAEKEVKEAVKMDTIELASYADESMVVEMPPEEAVQVKESPQVAVEQVEVTSKEEESNKEVTGQEDLPATQPSDVLTFVHPRLSRKPKMEKGKLVYRPNFIWSKSVGKFKDAASLEDIFTSFGISLKQEATDACLSLKAKDEKVLTLKFHIRGKEVFLDESHEFTCLNNRNRRPAFIISPTSSGSSCIPASSTSLQSGHYSSDISSGSSEHRSANLSCVHLNTTLPLSQEAALKTSTQNTSQATSFSIMFSKQNVEKLEPEPAQEVLKPAGRRGRAPKTTVPAKKQEVKPVNKRKRGGGKMGKSMTSDSEVEIQPPKKTLRRKRKQPEEKSEPLGLPHVTTSMSSESPKQMENTADKNIPKHEAIENVSENEVLTEEISESPHGLILPGVSVMARWKDGFYYPGSVVSQELEGRWSVRFHDNDVQVISQEHLIKIVNLKKGTSVMVQSSDEFYDPGIICGHYRDGQSVGYEVEMDTGVTQRYPRTSVILSTDQAQSLTDFRPSIAQTTNTINLDNIINGKRQRKSNTPASSPIAPKRVRQTNRTTRPDPNLESSEFTDASSSRTADNTADEETSSTVSEKRKTRKAAAKKAAPSKLFKNHAFLLTSTDRKTASESGNESDSEIIPFDREELTKTILTHGGMILNKYEDIQKCKRKTIFLLTNHYLRTIKYMQCLAAGILCLKFHWVLNSCSQSRLLDPNDYVLPAGMSIVKSELVEWHGKTDVLKDMRISIISSPGNPFVSIWTPVLLAAKAQFVQQFNLPSSKSRPHFIVDVLITNAECPSDILDIAKKRKIPIVSSEWVIQCLITGKRLPFAAHPKFKHDCLQ